jgi:lysyl-tRNA synthetase class 2
MRPEKKVRRDSAEAYTETGIPAEWVESLQKLGFLTVESMKGVSPGKLFNDLCGFNKKNKLGLKNPTADEVKGWVDA